MGARAVQAAIEAGCTLVDTAPLYGGTTVEKIVGNALRDRPDLAAKCTVVTKTGAYRGRKDHSFDGTLRSVEASLERLGLEQLDLVYIHDAMGVPMEDVMSEEWCARSVAQTPERRGSSLYRLGFQRSTDQHPLHRNRGI